MFFVTLGVLLYRAQPLLINVQPVYTTIAASAIAIVGALVILMAVSGKLAQRARRRSRWRPP